MAETVKSACNVGDPGVNPGSERSPGEGDGYPLQYSCLENPMHGQRILAVYSPWVANTFFFSQTTESEGSLLWNLGKWASERQNDFQLRMFVLNRGREQEICIY